MVSVITITFNRAHLIGETIRSVLSQSFDDFEYIMIDDGSTDNTEDVVNSFHDQRISYHKLVHTGSISKLRNAGLAKVKGDLIIFIDSDDLWKPDLLQHLTTSLMKDETIGFAFCDAEGFNTKETFVESIYDKGRVQHSSRNFFREVISDSKFFILTPCLMFRKKCLQTIGIFDERINHGDKDFICQLTFHFKGELLPQPLAMIRRHRENVTNSSTEELLETELYTLKKLVDANFISKTIFKKRCAHFHEKLGEYYSSQRNFSEAGNHFRVAFAFDSFNIRRCLNVFRTLFERQPQKAKGEDE
jgi:glycosyltransferase involved in cell wall biosynthesis